MNGARHRAPRPEPHMRTDRSSRIALAFLAFVGLAGPAWTLRTQAGQLLDSTDHRVDVAVPDVTPPSPFTGP
ncbi:hypothetical protein ACGFZH_20415 [Streptomyces zaomyceticus]|uniref:hypothetical protein n=1 Tax=Streptomyces TaxID=1883 RepID=UPI0037165E53